MAKLYDLSGAVVREVALPKTFTQDYKPEVIKKAFLVWCSQQRQPYGADPLAGKRTSAHYHGSRHYRFSMMNKETSRMPRIHGKVGYLAWTGRFAPHAVKGRRAHPPKAEKIFAKSINKKENLYAIRSALAASAKSDLVFRRHKVSDSPIIFVNDFENISKTKVVYELLEKLMSAELKRCSEKKVRAGLGKMRGRRYKKKKGPLIIVSKECSALKSAKNIPGVDVRTVKNMTINDLAPGGDAGRFLVISEAALSEIGKL